jgi:hypothetical protein
MAGTTTFDTYEAVGIREDLIDVIYDISPTDTPFVSNVGSGNAKGVKHEWQQDSLAAPVDDPVAEGADATLIALAPTTRLYNYTQINSKAFIISGTDLVADNAGRGVEMAYQEAKKGLELRKDIEYRCVGGDPLADPATDAGWDAGAGNSGGSPAARKAANMLAWLGNVAAVDNTVFDTVGTGGAPGADPALADGSVGRTDSTATTLPTFTEEMLSTVIDSIYLNGGNPDTIMSNTVQKRYISSTFSGSADQRQIMVPDKRVINAVDFYESDYGVLSVVPNRYMRQRDLFVLDTDMWEVSYHRPFQTFELAKTGDNEKKQMVVEWTLTAKEQASGGGVFDLNETYVAPA